MKKLQFQKPLMDRKKKQRKKKSNLVEESPVVNPHVKPVYQPYLYPNQNKGSRRKLNLSNRGIISSQEIKEGDVRKKDKKRGKSQFGSKKRDKKGKRSKGKGQFEQGGGGLSDSIQDIIGYPNGFKFRKTNLDMEQEISRMRDRSKKKEPQGLQRKKRKRSRSKVKTTPKKKYKIISRTKALKELDESIEKMRKNDEIFKANRNLMISQKSRKRLNLLIDKKGKKKSKSRVALPGPPMMPSLTIPLSSGEELPEQKAVEARQSDPKQLDLDEEEFPPGTLDSTQLKIVKQDIRNNMDEFFGPLDIKRTRIDSVRNAGMLCKDCLTIASKANARGEGIHIPRCKTPNCINNREKQPENQFNFSEIEEDIDEQISKGVFGESSRVLSTGLDLKKMTGGGAFMPEESDIINDDIAGMGQTKGDGKNVMPEESCIINDDIGMMGQTNELKEKGQDFGGQNLGFLESTPNAEMLASGLLKKNVDDNLLLGDSNALDFGDNDASKEEDPKKDGKKKKTQIGFGGFLSDDEPLEQKKEIKKSGAFGNGLMSEDSIDLGNLNTFAEEPKSGRFDDEKDLLQETEQVFDQKNKLASE